MAFVVLFGGVGVGSVTYKEAGVDIDAGNEAVRLMKQFLSHIGAFAGLFPCPGDPETILVASTDGLGTKTKVASALGRYDTIGYDIVNHCVNDVLTTGARPLFFLDYIGTHSVVPELVATIVKGIADACAEAGCALVGGETAEMPEIYGPGDFDLVGTLIGAVKRSNRLDGRTIQEGDILWGLASSGLHTNGYTLARKLLADLPLDKYLPELGRTVGDELLVPHHCYLDDVSRLQREVTVKGLVHITGGGFLDNIPRVLPQGLAAVIRKGSWPVLPIFEFLERRGNLSDAELYRAFNMGIGLVAIGQGQCPTGAHELGRVERQRGEERCLIHSSSG